MERDLDILHEMRQKVLTPKEQTLFNYAWTCGFNEGMRRHFKQEVSK